MKNIQYLEIFKQAWAITWKHKLLWWFGFLIFLSSLGGNFNYQSEQTKNSVELSATFIAFFQNHPFLSLTMLLFVLALVLFLFALNIVARASIIKTVANLAMYSKQNFRFLFREGLAHLRTLFLFEVLLVISVICLLLILATPVAFLFSLNATAFGIISTVIALAIFLPLLIFAYFCQRYVYLYRVLGNVTLWQAIESSYFLFRKNLREGLWMVLFSFTLSILFFMALLFVLLLCVLALGIIAFVPYLFLGKVSLLIFAILGGILLLFLTLAALSFLEVFRQTAWVLFFQEITHTKTPEEEIAKAIEPVQAGALS